MKIKAFVVFGLNRGDFTGKECIRLSSITSANRAKDILGINGISSKIRRATDPDDGCGYTLELSEENCEYAAGILKKSKINFKFKTSECDKA